MTADDIYDLHEKLEKITESLNELAKEYPYDPFRYAVKQAEELEDTIFKCMAFKAAYELSDRRSNDNETD